ncbi:hypothetical protein ACIOD0_22200 [Kitasatospora albolonga]
MDPCRIELVTHDEVGHSYFDDGDREVVVDVAVRLVNALRRFNVDIEGIGVSPVCHVCTPVPEAYKVDLGKLRADQVLAMAKQLDAYADEFQRMQDRERVEPEKPEATKRRKRNRN